VYKTNDNSIRFAPPLVMNREQLLEMFLSL